MTKMNGYYMYMLSYLMFSLMVIIMMLISVAFFTLFERKMLSYIHNRKGPNKASFIGLTQPLADALKLLSKEFLYSPKMSYPIYVLSPIMMMMISLTLWSLFPTKFNSWTFNFSIMIMLCCLSMSVYPIMLGGWASNSMYAMIGAMRGMAQTISYEVSLTLIIVSTLLMLESMNFYSLTKFYNNSCMSLMMFHLFMMLYISSLAEVNRTPFDFIEGESELVSGFNIEYFGFGFAFIFLAEYSMIIWMSGLNSIMFLSPNFFTFWTLTISFSMVWLRATLPRMRYDELMYMCWKIFLPASVASMSLNTLIKFFLISNMY